MNDFIATVSFPASLPLSLLAKKIDLAFKGLHLKKEDTGRFEEVPAYVGDSGGLEFVLFGIPEGEVSVSMNWLPSDSAVLTQGR